MTLIEEDMPDFLKQIMSQVMLEVRTENEAVELLHTLRQILRLSFKKSIYFLGENEKSRQKISKARNSYARIAQGEMPLICFDNTALGTADDGCLVTTRGIYIHNIMQSPIFLEYRNISNIEVRGVFSKEIYINDYELNVQLMDSGDVENFASLLQILAGKFGNPKFNLPRDNSSRQQTVNIYDPAQIKAYLQNVRQRSGKFNFKKSVYYYGDGDKSQQKISGAIKSYAAISDGEVPLICFDNTVFGSAKDGCLVTTRGVYVHNPMENVNFFDYKMFVIAEIRGTFIKDVYINDYKLDTNCMYGDDKDGFAELINLFVKDFSGEDSMYSLVMNS